MLKEENIIFDEINNPSDEKPNESHNYFCPFFNKLDAIISIKTNNYNPEETEPMTLNDMKNIMDAPKIDLEEDEYEEIYFTKKPKIDSQSIDGSTKISSILENKEEAFSRSINFKTMLRQKRGRKAKEGRKKKNNKCHCSDDFDNIQRKIQVNFISFLVRLANDALKNVFGQKTKYNFKHVDYELKKIVNHKYIEFLKKCKYSDIMKMKISPKNKKFGEDSNKKTFLEVCKHSDKLKKIFDKKYLYIFQKYYCNFLNGKNEIDFEGLKMTLSSKTKTISNLLEKNHSNKEKFKNVVRDVYFSDFNYNPDKKFITSSSFLPVLEEKNKI